MAAVTFGASELEVLPDELSPDMVVVDIREPYEWDAGHLPASIHVPLDQVAEWIVASPPTGPVVFVCLGGLRAAMVTRACVAIGLDARYLTGGLRRWVAEGHILDPTPGLLAPHGTPP